MENITFQQMELDPKTQKAIEEMGYSEPSPIQRMAIPAARLGKDLIGQAQTGTGKTAAFGIPIIEKINLTVRGVQALILVPTRELAIQVAGEFNKLAKYHKGIAVLPVYGGQDIQRQIRMLRQGTNVVIGTPGRILDHLERKTLDLSQASTIVLDEADEMLDMGFLEDITSILENAVCEEKQTMLFSATMPPAIQKLARRFQHEPEIIRVVHQEMTVPNVKQFYYEVREKDKPELLTRLIDFYNPNLAIVFVNRKIGAEELKERIHASGYSVEGLHGDMKQTQREYVMRRFRNGDFDILVATDVAARGLDVDDIDFVFNYDMPQDEEYYVHRIGRTARAGREGTAVTFVTMREFRQLKDIQRYTKTKIERAGIPTLKDVEKMRNQALLTSITEVIEAGGLDSYSSLITETMEEYSALEVAAALLKMISDKKAPASTSNIDEPKSREGRDMMSDASTGGGSVRFFINMGRQDKIGVRDLLDFLRKQTGLSGRNIGDISILDKFSFVNIPEDSAPEFLERMKNAKYQGRKIHAEPANSK